MPGVSSVVYCDNCHLSKQCNLVILGLLFNFQTVVVFFFHAVFLNMLCCKNLILIFVLKCAAVSCNESYTALLLCCEFFFLLI